GSGVSFRTAGRYDGLTSRLNIMEVGVWYSKTSRMLSAFKPRFPFVRFKFFPFLVMLDFQPRSRWILHPVVQRSNFWLRRSYWRHWRLNVIGCACIEKIE